MSIELELEVLEERIAPSLIGVSGNQVIVGWDNDYNNNNSNNGCCEEEQPCSKEA
ncbi:MAG: hypothetical protein ACREQP_04535 [Candidatus Binatia bacterium]